MPDKKKLHLFTVGLLLALFVIACYPTLKGLAAVWMADDDYSYGCLIPFISGYLVWQRRKELAEAPVSINWSGGVLFFLFILIGLYGVLGSNPSAIRLSLPLILISMILFCFGTKIARYLLFPLAFLVFMMPLPTTLQASVGTPLKLISTQLGGFILRLSGATAFIEGNAIDLGNTQLQVVDACAGLRFIFPLLALGFLFANFFETVRWKQASLVLVTIPIAIAMNGIRIGITGILAQHYDPKVAEGFFHGFSGWIIFVAAFVILLAFHFLFLKRIFRRRNKGATINSSWLEESAKVEHGQSIKTPNRAPVVICAACLLIVALLIHSTSAFPSLRLREGFGPFPQGFGGWTGSAETLDPEIVKLSGAQEALSELYRSKGGKNISLYVGYRGSPFLEGENFFHSPTVCLPSSGWTIIRNDIHKIDNVSHFGVLTVTKILMEKMGQKELVYYWFQTKSKTSSNVNVNRLHLSLHAIKRENTHDLFIRPITPVYPGESVQDAEKRMDDFVRDMMGALLKFLKENQYDG